MQASPATRLAGGSSRRHGPRPAPKAGLWSSSWSVRVTDGPPGARPAHLGLSGARRLKAAPRPRPAASAHQARAGRWTAASHHAPIIKGAVADQQHAHHHHQADPSLPPGQPRQVRNCLHADRATSEAGHRVGRAGAPASRVSPTRVRPADGPSGSSPSGRCGRGWLSSSTEIDRTSAAGLQPSAAGLQAPFERQSPQYARAARPEEVGAANSL